MDNIRQVIEFLLPKATYQTIDLITYCTFSALWVVVTVLAALGIHRLAKNKGIDRLWRAYIPFYNLVVLGEIVGSAPVFGKRVKNVGVICMVLQALFVFDVVFTEITYVFNDVFGFYVLKEQAIGETVMTYWAPHGVGLVYEVFSVILSLATLIFSFALYLEIFRSYAPSGAMAICILTVFFSPVAPVALFAIRNRKYVDFREYMKAKMAAFYGAPQHPTQPPQSPFGEYPDAHKDPYYSPQRPARPTAPTGDPFEEFSEKPKGEDKQDDDYFN